jgi:hypothetical protein
METVNNIKVIFLDIDGVLNNQASLAEGIHLLPEKCLLVKRIVEETDAKIVISSTWRIGEDIKHLRNILWRSGIPRSAIIDKTPIIDDGIRGSEIEEWLKNNNHVIGYIIIDDDSDFFDYQKKFFINTHFTIGITNKDVRKSIELLAT